jgi:hypothetical protein
MGLLDRGREALLVLTFTRVISAALLWAVAAGAAGAQTVSGDGCEILQSLRADFQRRNPRAKQIRVVDARPTYYEN